MEQAGDALTATPTRAMGFVDLPFGLSAFPETLNCNHK